MDRRIGGGFVTRIAFWVVISILMLTLGMTLWIESRDSPPNPAELAAWDRARSADDATAYRRFLAQWGASGYAPQASLRLDRLRAEQAERDANERERQVQLIMAAQQGLRRLGVEVDAFVKEAATTERHLRDFLSIVATDQLRIDESLVTRIEAAVLAREPLVWAEAAAVNRIETYQQFIERYPNGRFIEAARDRIAALQADFERRALIQAIQVQLQRLGQSVIPTGTLEAETAASLRELALLQTGTERVSIDADALAELEQLERWPLRPGDVFRDCLACPEMVVIPAGSFLMGSPDREYGRQPSEGPQHEVSVAQFAIGRTEVSFGQWQSCLDQGACSIQPDDAGWGRGTRPVIYVSLEDAQAYARWLSEVSGAWYRLPSEAEWEYAARAGSATSFPSGPCLSSDQANFDASRSFGRCAIGIALGQTMPVGSYPPNAFGLHDMHGNVREWVTDCWNPDYRGAPVDARAWMTGDCGRAVVRGGAWSDTAIQVRSASRTRPSGSFHNDRTGFRVVREMPHEARP